MTREDFRKRTVNEHPRKNIDHVSISEPLYVKRLNSIFEDQAAFYEVEFIALSWEWMFIIYLVTGADNKNDEFVVSSDSLGTRFISFEEASDEFFNYLESEHWYRKALDIETKARQHRTGDSKRIKFNM